MKQQAVAHSNSDVCPVCGGTGYELIKESAEGYTFPLQFCRPCTRCSAQMRAQDETGVPPQFCNADLTKFGFDSYSRDMTNLRRIAEDFVYNYEMRWQKQAKGLYLWSKTPGTGKSFLSCCIGRSAMIKHNLQFRFVTAPDYLAKVRESYSRQPGVEDRSRVYRECALLVLDDICAQKSGEWQDQEVFRIINERLNAGRITIYTSNTPPEELNLNPRTIGRITKSSVVLQMPEESIREKLARKEQEEFLSQILRD